MVGSAAVAAYLIGTVIISAFEVAVREIDHRLLMRSMAIWPYEGEKHVVLRFLTPFSRPSLARLSQTCNGNQELMSAVCRNILTGGGNRLLVSNERLHGQFDRLRSEVEFRHGLAIPFLFLVWAATLRVSWGASLEGFAWTLAVLIDLALLLQARVLSKWSFSLHAHAVADGDVSTPALDEERMLHDGRSSGVEAPEVSPPEVRARRRSHRCR